MTDPARIQRIAAAVHESAARNRPSTLLVGDATAADLCELAIAASQAVAGAAQATETEWVGNNDGACAVYTGPLRLEVARWGRDSDWTWAVMIGGRRHAGELVGGRSPTLDAAKAAAIAAARAWRDSIRL